VKQARFRKQVLEAAGHQCQAEVNGLRCFITGDEYLCAHHTVPGSWDVADGVALCRRHHRAVDVHAR
jgi:predicted restriction endonuclease